jgi:hypothetical protein
MKRIVNQLTAMFAQLKTTNTQIKALGSNVDEFMLHEELWVSYSRLLKIASLTQPLQGQANLSHCSSKPTP